MSRRFEQLVRTHVGAVTAYARALTSDRWLADDAVQETFLRAFKYQDSFRGEGSYEGWLLRICRNVVIDLATATGSQRLPIEPLLADDPRLTRHLDVDRAELLAIDDALRTLPVAQREALVLCAVLGYDYAEAAGLLDVPVGTIRSRISRARGAMAETLARSDDRSVG